MYTFLGESNSHTVECTPTIESTIQNHFFRITSSSKPKRRAISLQEKLNFCTRSSKSLFNRTDHLPRELGRCLTLEFVSMNTYSPIVHPFCFQPVCSFRSILGSVVMRLFKENRNAALFLSSPPNLNPRLFCLQKWNPIQRRSSPTNTPNHQKSPNLHFPSSLNAYDGSHASACGSIDPDSGSSGKHACSS